jgi:potassium-transporting ATPase KdpC subunit
MLRNLRPALVMLGLFTVLTGVVYPLAVTGLSLAFFNHQANGSLITDASGNVIGSALIGQPVSDPKYFWGRLSATPDFPYNAASSSGSNLGPDNPALLAAVQARIDALHAADPGNTQPIPVDLVTASASGLDPDISPAAALYQVPRVARLRGLSIEDVTSLVNSHTAGRWLGIFGEPRVNVLELNLALDKLAGGS